MRADALATALMVLGPAGGYELALKEKIAALFIVKGEKGFHEKMTPLFRDDDMSLEICHIWRSKVATKLEDPHIEKGI